MALPFPPYRCFLLVFVSRQSFISDSPCCSSPSLVLLGLLILSPMSFPTSPSSFLDGFPSSASFPSTPSLIPYSLFCLCYTFSQHLPFFVFQRAHPCPAYLVLGEASTSGQSSYPACLLPLLWWFWQDFRRRGLSASSQPAPVFKYPLFAGRYSLVPQTS